MTRHTRCICLFVLLALSGRIASAQTAPATGAPPFGSFGGGPDVINLANLNSHIDIPVLRRPGRGTDFTYDLSYDTSVWSPVTSGSTTSWQPALNWGWRGQTEAVTGYMSYTITTQSTQFCTTTTYSNWAYHDPFGASHPFHGTSGRVSGSVQHCGTNNTWNFTATAYDGSGYTIQPVVSTGWQEFVTSSAGTAINGPQNSGSGAGNFTDRNGNQLTANASGQFFDTLSNSLQVLAVSGNQTASSPLVFSYTAPGSAHCNATNSSLACFTVNYANYTVATNFGFSGTISEYKSPAAVPLVTSISLPDGSQYTFAYEPTPSIPASGACTPYAGTTCTTARLTSVTLPTGGTITYSYSGGNNGILSDGSTATLTRTLNPGGTWTYAQVKGATAPASTTTITDPASNVTTIQFQGIYETQRVVNQGASTVLKSINTCYNSSVSPCTTLAISLPILRRTVRDQFGLSGSLCVHDSVYNSYGLLTEQDDYDYPAGGALLRQQLISYAALGNGIVSMPSVVTTKDGGGTIKAQASLCYDEATPSGTPTCGSTGSPTGTSGTPQHVAVTGSRGNVTTIANLVSSGITLGQKLTYYDTGNVNQATDVNGAPTTYSYAGSSCGNSFPTSVTEPLSLSRSMTWNCTGGVQLTSKDENNQTTTTAYTDAYFWRPASQTFPDSGLTSWTYNSPTSVTTTTKIDATHNLVSTVLLDSLGRDSQTQLNSDPGGVSYSAITYDSLGRVQYVYNPTRCNPPTTNCGGTAETTWGKTTYAYDALNRQSSVIDPDGSTASVSFSNNTATVTDEAGKKRLLQHDALGRVNQVTEDPAGSAYVTNYTYDPLGDLTGVTQNSSRQRTFAYDDLSRLTSSTTPESGAVTYNYDTNGDLHTRVDARSITTTYTYDLLHRLTQQAYSDSTPTAKFYYDAAPSFWSAGETNTSGRLVEATTANTATELSYDPVGRVNKRTFCTPMNCTVGPNGATGSAWQMSYTYDLNSDMTSYTNGFAKTFTQGFDTAGRFYNLTTNWSDATHPGSLAEADWRAISPYNPSGAPLGLLLWNNVEQTFAYNPRLQPCRVNVNSANTMLATCADSVPSGNLLDLQAGFNAGSTDNGDVTSWSATGNQTFNRTYTYDSLNRVKTMADSATAQPCKGLSWTYDAWGNRTDQTQTSGTCGAFHASVTTQNRLNDPINNIYQYDASGNLTYDGSHHYAYDAEARLVTVDPGATPTASYVYDAFGRRVKKTVGAYTAEYMYTLDGRIDSMIENGVLSRGFVYLNGRPLVEYANNTTYFIHPDHLGSTRLLTNYPTPTVAESDDYYPFGEFNTTPSTVPLKFTGDEYDSETSSDHTLFRQHFPLQGRWSVADPADLAAANLAFPQSWNRYAYVDNNPLALVDPTGLVCDGANIFSMDILANGTGIFTPEDCAASGGTWISGVNSCYTSWGPGLCGDSNPPSSSGGSGNGAVAGSNNSGTNNGRNCTVGSASTGQYAAATAQVAAMTGEFFSGLGPGSPTFTPNSATSQVMAQSAGVQSVLNTYNQAGQTSGLYTFGLSGLVAAGGNPVAQFVGSFRWSIAPGNGGINLSLTNTTSFRSLTYDRGPQWQRGNHWYPTPMGNTHQTYNITAKCQ